MPYAIELLGNPPDGTTNPPGGSGNSDTGRSQFDNHTYDDTPTLFFRLDDGIFLNDLPGNRATDSPPDEIIPIPFQAGVVQPATPGYAIAVFDEGSHFLTARVQMIDPAATQQTGFGPRSVPLEVVIDITPPPVTFGDPARWDQPDRCDRMVRNGPAWPTRRGRL